eukprot:TRINITY_DN8369_c0_g1_i23.p1 TRINITY_DN8369_c0_g1~~TRINITY_DN8369_c0_g1_i23.p1  ORF type:complete len:298 (-),score=80.97 TRINITY_DN8369_c0_g1_i23:128-925(-)
MTDLFYSFAQATEVLEISEAYAIFNEVLLMSFVSQYQILTTRIVNNPNLFNKAVWRTEKGSDEREVVFANLQERIQSISWNADAQIPILPLLHGTDFGIATSIASSGFAILSSLDAGWYGKGIYFTTYVKYCLPYFSNRKDPAIIISFVVLGNVYPVIEVPNTEDSLMGSALKAGYNSHFITVSADGVPASTEAIKKGTMIFDEYVIPQENQIVPVYILRFKPFDGRKLLKKWKDDRTMMSRRASRFVVPAKQNQPPVALRSSAI